MVVGAPTPDGATFVAKVTGGPVRVAVSTDESMSAPVFTASQAVDAQGVAKVAITGLAANTRHWWRVEDSGTVDTSVTGQFRTLPTAGLPASFTIAAFGDSGLGPGTPGTGTTLGDTLVSNHVVHDTIRTRALAGDWLMGVHLGDWGYPDWGTNLTDTLANRRTFYDDLLLQSRQAALFRSLPLTYLWDDHDFAANNSDGDYADKANGATVYRERVPHHTLPDASAIYHSFTIGRVLFVASDVRYNRSPNGDTDDASKTMLGSVQKSWMEGILSASDAELLVWLNPQQWIEVVADSWGSFTTERAELVQLLGDLGWLGRAVQLTADMHGVAIDTGVNSAGGIPILACAALDATPTGNPALYSLGGQTGRNQHGTLAVTDVGNAIQVRLAGWQGTTEVLSHQFGFTLSTATTIASGALLRTLTGSQTPIIEARLVTGHPTGDDPDGIEIQVSDGDVTYDGTADIRATMQLGVLGMNERNGSSAFPRFTSDDFSPLRGAEIFLAYTLDLGGGGQIRTPLGYFRFYETDQPTAPYGGMILAGRDRMGSIVKGRLLAPRSYSADQTLGSVAADLILDIFPNAVIAWDDTSDQDQIGRVLLAEERHGALRELADSRGKLFYVDDEGVFRFEAAPDETVPVWEAKAGRDGVLFGASRRVTSDDVHNAVVATGSAADDQQPQRVVAVDNDPNSPTYFFGQFGQVPRFFESPLITTSDQVAAAAVSLLRRSLGASIQAEVATAVNPTLRPWHPVRTQMRDGNRDIVVMQRVVVPLGKRRPMTGTARSQMVAAVTNVGILA